MTELKQCPVISLLKYIGIGTIAYLLFKRVGNVINDQISIVSARAREFSITLTELKFILSLELQNDSLVPIPVDHFYGSIYYGDILISNVQTNNAVTLQPGMATSFDANINTAIPALLTNITDLINSGSFLNSMKIKGTVHSNGIRIPVEKTILSV